MLSFTSQRLAVALSVALTVSIVAFLLLHLSGDLATAIAGPEATAAQIAEIRHQFGLDRPMTLQYLDWLWRALHFDFGNSFYYRDTVTSLVASRMPVTMTLGAISLTLALVIAIPLGVLAAVYSGTIVDLVALGFCVLGQAVLAFCLGLGLIIVFAVQLRWLPVSGTASWKNYIMPSVALGWYAVPAVMRLSRNGMLEVLSSDYIRTARATGLRPTVVILKHALRIAIFSGVPLAAVQFGFMLGGSIVIETIFQINGLGYLAWESIQRKDLPVMQAIVLVLSVIYVLLTLAADLLNAALDPRLRAS